MANTIKSPPILTRILRKTAVLLVRMGRLLIESVPRLYSLVILILVCWLTYRAVRYLVVSLIVPSGVPAQIAGLPTRMTEEVLRSERQAFPALDLTETPRTPLAHYHRLDGWIEPDPKNDCTRSGCHAPLPHNRRKETRAFLNMHATSIHCGVCHMEADKHPVDLVWYELKTGNERPPPALLQAYELLTSPLQRPRADTPDVAFQRELSRQLRAAAKEAGDSYVIEEMARHVDAIRPNNPIFKDLLASIRENLPKHFRGEYGAKLAVRDAAKGGPVLSHPGTGRAVTDYLANRDSMGPTERETALKSIHPLRRPEALVCSDCHRRETWRVDYRAAGYPEARIEALVHPVVAEMIENIDKGRRFVFPGFMPAPEQGGE